MEYEEFKSEVLCGREIEFKCRNVDFFIGHSEKGIYISSGSKDIDYFSSCRELMENARVFELSIEEIWNEIEVEYIL